MRSRKFLLEIGVEDLPSSIVQRGEKLLSRSFSSFLDENYIRYSGIKSYCTPRRLSIYVKELYEFQKKIKKRLIGPPAKVGIDGEGKFTTASIKFAEKNQIPVEFLKVFELEKGSYVGAEVEEGGKSTRDILQKYLPEYICSLKFNKTMFFGENFLFPRPIRWLVCLFGGKILPIKLNSLVAGDKTKGHRLIKNTSLSVSYPDKYDKILESAGVVISFEKRKKIILQKLKEEAKQRGGELLKDEELLNEVTGMVEYPGVVSGEFSADYLNLPEIFIITAMRIHQRYFAVKDRKGKLLPYFLSTIDNKEDRKFQIIPGLTEVLIARLEDAKFYIQEDLKIPLEKRLDDLKEIVWDEELGSVYDKVMRILSFFKSIEVPEELNKNLIERTIYLSRTDLTTEMVRDGKEFTRLEGFVASAYAEIQNEDEGVVEILREYRRPLFPGDEVPRRKESAFLGIMDRWDTFIGYYLKGYRPKGSKDPLGIRRVLQGFFDCIIEFGFRFSLNKWIDRAINLYKSKNNVQEIANFIFERFEKYLEEKRNIRYDIVDSAVAVGVDDLYNIYLRAHYLNQIYEEDEKTFLSVVIGQKRVANILKDIDKIPSISPEYFEKKEEKKLYQALKQAEPRVEKLIKEEKFKDALNALLLLRPLIDAYFDNVFVMTDSDKLRKNRLATLLYARQLFCEYGDFSHIVVSGGDEN